MDKIIVFGVIIALCLAFVNTTRRLRFYEEKDVHDPAPLTDDSIRKLASLSNPKDFRRVLDEILVPRVPGTPNHKKVGDFIIKEMKSLGWSVEEQVFPANTPIGMINFRNIVARLNPDADRFLVLAAHYDTKLFREHAFVGATDSAVPCAMMINLARVMSQYLEPCKRANLSLMFIFFDGEEAFKQWSATDSLYGARHAAQKWQNEAYPKDNANQLNRIDVFMLLDLLGAPDPTFYSYFSSTEKWHVRLANAETKLARLGHFQGYSLGKPEQNYFRLRSSNSAIEDDHIPFLRRDVPILHVIANPFPSVWHEPGDDLSALDFNTIDNLNKIFRCFVAEYLSLNI